VQSGALMARGAGEALPSRRITPGFSTSPLRHAS
jgi:hypothetical protein